MAGVYSGGSWIPFVDQMGRQGWYNQANGQTTYQMGQMYGGYNAGALVPGQMPPVQPQLYPQQVPQVPMGYMPQPPMVMPQIPQMQMMPQPQPQQQFQPRQPQPQVPPGWQPMFDRAGRRYYYNPTTGQSVYQF